MKGKILLTFALVFLLMFVPAAFQIALGGQGIDVSNGKQDSADRHLVEKLKNITPEGWKIDQKIRRFTPENLYLQIDGRAPLYKDYGVMSATFVNYMNRSDEMQFIELALYDMGNPANGFGIFSVERDPDASSLGLGRRSYGSEGSCYVWKGRYYLQIIASDAMQELQGITIETARRLSALLSDRGEPVRGLLLLPREGLVPDSEQYYRVNALGMDFMKDTYVARYRKNNQTVTVFLSEKSRPDLAGETLFRYVRFAQQFGEGVETLKNGDREIMLSNMGGAYDVVFQKSRLVAGVSSLEDRDLAVQMGFELWKRISDPETRNGMKE